MKCELCGSNLSDSVKYGDFLTKHGKSVHTNCLYLSSGLDQHGRDDEGILGFLLKDIRRERDRASKVQCCYCGDMHANIGCCEVRCHRSFHLICGTKCGAMNQFIGTYRSYCDRHARKVKYRPKKDETCCICYDKIFNESKRFSAVNMLRAPCCRNGWFHKMCLQKFAMTAGYFFKCPLCNDSDKFKSSMSYWGVFIQNKDAEWELVPNAYAELHERPSTCGAQICYNVGGRDHSSNANPFLMCTTCGSVAIHRCCTTNGDSSFQCEGCMQVIKQYVKRETGVNRQQTEDRLTETEDVDVDVCGDSDVDECIMVTKGEDTDEDVNRPNRKYKHPMQITSEGEDLAYDEDLGCSRQIVKQNADTIHDTEELDSSTKCRLWIDKIDKQFDKAGSLSLYYNSVDDSENEHLEDNSEQQRGSSRLITASIMQSNAEVVDLHKTVDEPNLNRKHSTNLDGSISEDDIDLIQIVCRPRIRRQISDSSNDSDDEDMLFISDECSSLHSHSDHKQKHTKMNLRRTVPKVTCLQSQRRCLTTQVEENCENTNTLNVNSTTNRRPQSTNGIHAKTRKCRVSEQNSALNESFIAQRTRRKSLSSRTAAFAYVNSSVDDISSISSYQTSIQQGSPACGSKLKVENTRVNDDGIHSRFSDGRFTDLSKTTAKRRIEEVHKTKSNMKEHCNQNKHSDKCDVLDYFYKLLNEVKKGSNRNTEYIKCMTHNIKHVYKIPNSDKDTIIDALNESCIANRTRRRSIINNFVKSIGEDVLGNVVLPISKETNKTTAVNNNSEKRRTNKSTELFNSATNCGRSCSHSEYYDENYNAAMACEKACDVNNYQESVPRNFLNSNTTATSTKSDQIKMPQKRKSTTETYIPPKIPALVIDDSEPESATNVPERMRIANRSRRKSADLSKVNQINNIKPKDRPNTRTKNSKTSESEGTRNELEFSCIANRTRRKSVDHRKFASLHEDKRTQPILTSNVETTAKLHNSPSGCSDVSHITISSAYSTTTHSSQLLYESSDSSCFTPHSQGGLSISASINSRVWLSRAENMNVRTKLFSDSFEENDYDTMVHSSTQNGQCWPSLRKKTRC